MNSRTHINSARPLQYLVSESGRLYKVEGTSVDFYDAIPLSAVSHCCSRFLTHREREGDHRPLKYKLPFARRPEHLVLGSYCTERHTLHK